MPRDPRLEIDIRPEALAIVRLDAAHGVPSWALDGDGLAAIVRRGAELSIVRAESEVPAGLGAVGGWRALEVRGPLDLGLTGVLASIAVPLAEVGVSIFAVSTYDTDLVLVAGSELSRAREALEGAGHVLFGSASDT